MNRSMTQKRRGATARRIETGTTLSLAAPVAVEGTPIERGAANLRRYERQRRLRRLMRALGMPLLVSLAAVSGFAVGYLGDGSPQLRVIAPTTLPVTTPSTAATPLPLALLPAPHHLPPARGL